MENETIVGLIAIVAIVAVGVCTGYVETTSATPESELALAPGYKWYQDDEFSYKIGYPENWEKTTLLLQEGQEAGIGFMSDKQRPNGASEATILVTVFSDPKQARFWETEEFKEQGMDVEHQKVIINGREGDEVIFYPLGGMVKQRLIVFTLASDLHYVVTVYTTIDLYDQYADTFDTAINSFDSPAPVVATPTPEEGLPEKEIIPPEEEVPEEVPLTPTPSKEQPGFEAIFAIVGLLAVAYLLRRRG